MTISTLIFALTSLGAGCATEPVEPEVPAALKPEYVQWVDSAEWYGRRERWEDAKRCTIEAMRTDPANFTNSLLLSNLGSYELYLGNPEEALRNFNLGLSMSPASTTLLSGRAKAHLLLGNAAEAEADLKRLLESDPTDAWVLKMYGLLLMRGGHAEEAFAVLARIVEPDADTLSVMAPLALQRGEEKYAEKLYDTLIEKFPSAEAYADRALFFLNADRLPEAADDIREGIKLNDRYGNLYLCRAYLNRLRHENALVEIDKKLALEYNADGELFTTLFPPKKKKK